MLVDEAAGFVGLVTTEMVIASSPAAHEGGLTVFTRGLFPLSDKTVRWLHSERVFGGLRDQLIERSVHGD